MSCCRWFPATTGPPDHIWQFLLLYRWSPQTIYSIIGGPLATHDPLPKTILACGALNSGLSVQGDQACIMDGPPPCMHIIHSYLWNISCRHANLNCIAIKVQSLHYDVCIKFQFSGTKQSLHS